MFLRKKILKFDKQFLKVLNSYEPLKRKLLRVYLKLYGKP